MSKKVYVVDVPIWQYVVVEADSFSDAWDVACDLVAKEGEHLPKSEFLIDDFHAGSVTDTATQTTELFS